MSVFSMYWNTIFVRNIFETDAIQQVLPVCLWYYFQCVLSLFLSLSMIQLFSIIVFGCISSQGWRVDESNKKDYCLYNNNPNACNYGVTVGVIGFLASMGFIAGEYFFEQFSSVKTRKHYVLADLGFSGKLILIFFLIWFLQLFTCLFYSFLFYHSYNYNFDKTNQLIDA